MWSSRHFEDILENPSASPSEVVRVVAKHFQRLTEAKLTRKTEFLLDDMERLLAKRPGHGAVLNLLNGALLELEGNSIDNLGPWFANWISEWEKAIDGIRRIGTALIPPQARVLTVSRSTNVLKLLESIAGTGLSPLIICGESYPGGEGRVMAKKIAASGLRVDFYPDCALPSRAFDADIVLIGAAAVGQISGTSSAGLIAKTGTLAVLQAARAARVLAYVVVPPEAVVPISLSRDLRLPTHGKEEIWLDPPPRVAVKSTAMEVCPLELVNGILSGGGAIEPMQMLAQKASVPRAERLPGLAVVS